MKKNILFAAISLISYNVKATDFSLNVGNGPGMIVTTTNQTCPNGTLPADGSSVDPGVYPKLAQLYKTTPDLRGQFLRGIDYAQTGTNNGPSFIDPDRGGVGGSPLLTDQNPLAYEITYQQDSLQGHAHQVSLPSMFVNRVGFGTSNNVFDQAFNIDSPVVGTSNPVASGYGTPRVGSETRPVNVAVLYCITVQ